MIIYKITNNINKKIYIGQTIDRLCNRWAQHNYNVNNKTNKPLYNAMRKYGVENFQIEEIGGANSISELNYQEWLLIHKNNTLWPNGYNLREGGGNRGKNSSQSIKKMSQSQKNWYKNNKPPRSKKVINIETGKLYDSAAQCARENNITGKSGFRAKLNGKIGNNTPFRYVGMENVYKEPGAGAPKKVINIETKEIYKSAADCAKQNNINVTNLRDKLTGKRGNNTNFRYLGMENVCKEPKPGAAKKVVNKNTGVIYKSAADCARKNNINYGTLKSMLSGHDRNSTNFEYIENVIL